MPKIAKNMSLITIVGIVLIAIGTIMSIYGQQKKSSKDTDSIKEEIDSFSKKLEQAKMDTSSVGKEKLIKIENEFDDWAKEFISDKDERLLDFKVADINIKKKEVALSKTWHPKYQQLFTDIQNYIIAYNKHTGGSIQYKFSEFPTDLFSETLNELIYTISFSQNRHWIIFFRTSSPIDNDNIPTIRITVVDQIDKIDTLKNRLHVEIDFNFYVGLNQLTIHKSNKEIIISELPTRYSLDETPDALTEVFRKLLEYEFLKKAG